MSPRAVLDTNVVLAGKRTRSLTSPNLEVLHRWSRGEFEWLYSDGILEEYSEKLLQAGVSAREILQFIYEIKNLGEEVPIKFFHTRYYPCDPDDIIFLLTALNGAASHLLTYDDDLVDVSVHYPEFITCRPVEFLAALRG
jgi:putative PIN family toxin of toxin-antitoxin system